MNTIYYRRRITVAYIALVALVFLAGALASGNPHQVGFFVDAWVSGIAMVLGVYGGLRAFYALRRFHMLVRVVAALAVPYAFVQVLLLIAPVT